MTMVSDGAISIGGSGTRNGLNQSISNEWDCATDLETERIAAGLGHPVSMSQFYGLANVIPGNQFFSSSQVFTLPRTAGTSISMMVVGGGGGGGGGSARTAHNPRGPGGGGGGGGYAFVRNFTVPLMSSLYISIGGGGGGGNACDGGYGNYGDSGAGGQSYIYSYGNGNYPVGVSGGGAGGNSFYYNLGSIVPAGADGTAWAGTSYHYGGNGGGYGQYGITDGGGFGEDGLSLDTTIGIAWYRIVSVSYSAQGGVGNDTGIYAGSSRGTYIPAQSGFSYGGGGGGGGSNDEFGGEGPGINGAAGAPGCALVWWGYG